MLTTVFSKTLSPPGRQTNKEGDLYKIINIKGRKFELRYGFYEEIDRLRGEPDIIYPDLIDEPQYTDCGHPIVTQMQDACRHYKGHGDTECDCSQCAHFEKAEDLFGICRCPSLKKHKK